MKMKKMSLKLIALAVFSIALSVQSFAQCDYGTVSFVRNGDQVSVSPDGRTILSAQSNGGHSYNDLNDGDVYSFAPVMVSHPASAPSSQISGGAHITYTIDYESAEDANLYLKMARGSFGGSDVFQNVVVTAYNGRTQVFSETVRGIAQTSSSWDASGNTEAGIYVNSGGAFDRITIRVSTVSGGSGSGIWLQVFEVQRISKSAAVQPDGTGLEDACPGTTTLGVSFAPEITATIKNNILTVNWSTMTETNSDHFVIESSLDGENFMPIGTVDSKAEGGNSTGRIDYDFTHSTSNAMALAGFSAFGIGILLLSMRRKKKMVMFAVLCFIGSISLFVSCSKEMEKQQEIPHQGDSFIRIKQVDKDGSSDYSKVVEIVYLKG